MRRSPTESAPPIETGRGLGDNHEPDLARELASCIEESREAVARIASLIGSFGQLQQPQRIGGAVGFHVLNEWMSRAKPDGVERRKNP